MNGSIRDLVITYFMSALAFELDNLYEGPSAQRDGWIDDDIASMKSYAHQWFGISL